MANFSKVILVVLDGFGIASPSPWNAVSQANPKFFQELIAHYPTFVLQASGPAVGLSWGERGNSEVGHLNLGAGRVVAQELPRINRAIADGSFYSNEAFEGAISKVLKTSGTLHIAGMVGTGTVHAYEQHLYSLIGLATDRGVKRMAIHAFTDGRDSPPKTGLESIRKIQTKLPEGGVIATVTGRFYAMDRGEHWEQTQATLKAMIQGDGKTATDAADAVARYYADGITDEMIPPTVITDASGSAVSKLGSDDSIIFFNYRNDRMIQMVKKLQELAPEVLIVSMTAYAPEFTKVQAAFPPAEIINSLPEVISKQGWAQFHAAESEKFAHVTFFFNGHRFDPWPKEDREIIKSPAGNAKNYEDVPQMSAIPLTDAVVRRIKEHDDRFILVNYANGDMVGHTGSILAAKQAVLVLDECLKRLAEAAEAAGSLLIITADHGNCEQMKDFHSGQPDTEHTDNPIPAIFYSPELKITGRGLTLETLAGIMPQGILPDIAPTILKALGLEPPIEMTGTALKID